MTNLNIVEKEHVKLLLQSLPDFYDHIMINITNNNIDEHLHFDDVRVILEEEFRWKSKVERVESLKQSIDFNDGER